MAPSARARAAAQTVAAHWTLEEGAWPTNLVGYDALTSYALPSYFAQQLLAANHGRTVLSSSYTGTGSAPTLTTKDSRGRLYPTVVTPGAAAQSVRVSISGAGHLPAGGTATPLSAPVTTRTGGLGRSFDRAFPPISLPSSASANRALRSSRSHHLQSAWGSGRPACARG